MVLFSQFPQPPHHLGRANCPHHFEEKKYLFRKLDWPQTRLKIKVSTLWDTKIAELIHYSSRVNEALIYNRSITPLFLCYIFRVFISYLFYIHSWLWKLYNLCSYLITYECQQINNRMIERDCRKLFLGTLNIKSIIRTI